MHCSHTHTHTCTKDTGSNGNIIINITGFCTDSLTFMNKVNVVNAPPCISHLLCPPLNTIHHFVSNKRAAALTGHTGGGELPARKPDSSDVCSRCPVLTLNLSSSVILQLSQQTAHPRAPAFLQRAPATCVFFLGWWGANFLSLRNVIREN